MAAVLDHWNAFYGRHQAPGRGAGTPGSPVAQQIQRAEGVGRTGSLPDGRHDLQSGNVAPAPPDNRARIAELEQVVWEQTLALVSRFTQLADLCNKHQQQKDELDLAFNEIMRLERLEAEARREVGTIEQQAQAQIKELQAQLEAERLKLGEARSACTQLKKKLLDAETKLNDAQVLVVIASERCAASDRALKRASEEGARLRAEADARSKAHKIEVDGLRSFHIACLDQIRRPARRDHPFLA